MVRLALLLTATFVTLGQAFTALPTRDGSIRMHSGNPPSNAPSVQPLHMVAAASDGFDEDHNVQRRRSSSGKRNNNENGNWDLSTSEGTTSGSSKFVTGDEMHRLRHEVLAMRLELQEARRSGTIDQVEALERAIMKAQQVDAEFVYTVSLERMELAQQEDPGQGQEPCKEQGSSSSPRMDRWKTPCSIRSV